MRKADVFVLRLEELGFVLVEAAFNNLFIISSDVQTVQRNLLIEINAEFYLKTMKIILYYLP